MTKRNTTRNRRSAEGMRKFHESPETAVESSPVTPDTEVFEVAKDDIEKLAQVLVENYRTANNPIPPVQKWDVYPGFFGPNGQYEMYARTYSSAPLGMVAYNDAEKMQFTKRDFKGLAIMRVPLDGKPLYETLDEMSKKNGHTKYFGGLALFSALFSTDYIQELLPGKYLFANALFTNEKEQWCALLVEGIPIEGGGMRVEYDLYPLAKESESTDMRVLTIWEKK